MITEEYRQQLEQLHVQRDDFGRSGSQWAHACVNLCAVLETNDVLDYGCGKAELNLSLPFDVKCYDPAIYKYRDAPEPADLVFCTDVLEHIEPEQLDAVIADLVRVTKRLGVFAIHIGPAKKTLPDGRNAHLIQRPGKWWKNKLERSFDVRDEQMVNPMTYLITVEPKGD